jgi:hypothetical protein
MVDPSGGWCAPAFAECVICGKPVDESHRPGCSSAVQVNPYPLDLAAIATTAAEWREAWHRQFTDEGFFLIVPWHMVVDQGGWEPFCEYFTGFTRRMRPSPTIVGCQAIDPDGQVHKFTVPQRGELAAEAVPPCVACLSGDIEHQSTPACPETHTCWKNCGEDCCIGQPPEIP